MVLRSYRVSLGRGLVRTPDRASNSAPYANIFFQNMVDELVGVSDYDPELAEGLAWIDGEAKRRNIGFYEMVFNVLQSYDAGKKAKEWSASRNGNP